MLALIAALAAGLAVRLAAPRWLLWLGRHGRRVPNYRGTALPTSAGTLPAVLAAAAALAAGAPYGLVLPVALFVAVGAFDDQLGDGRSRGFGGHARSLAAGRLTTGTVKAVAGGAGAMLAALTLGGPPLATLLAALTLALSANFVNLLDVRPGRALKGTALFALLFAPWGGSHLLLPLVAVALAALPEDLGERAILGDAGAMGLGYLLGAGALTAARPAGVLWLAFVVVAHLYAERGSLSRLIDRTPWLLALDRLGGRRRP